MGYRAGLAGVALTPALLAAACGAGILSAWIGSVDFILATVPPVLMLATLTLLVE